MQRSVDERAGGVFEKFTSKRDVRQCRVKQVGAEGQDVVITELEHEEAGWKADEISFCFSRRYPFDSDTQHSIS